jgi:hypothetical protein
MKLTDLERAQINHFVGRIELTLPRRLHLRISDALAEELAGLPDTTAAEIAQNCIAAVALTLRSSKTDKIYEAEAERIRHQADTEDRVNAYQRLQLARDRHQGAVEFVEIALLKRSTAQHVIDNALRSFFEQITDDPDRQLLIDWALSLNKKRKELFQ